MSIFKLSRSAARRDTQLKLLMTADEKKALDAAASEFGLTTSDLMREALNEYIERRKSQKKSRK